MKEVLGIFKEVELLSSSNTIENKPSYEWNGFGEFNYTEDKVVLLKGNEYYFLYKEKQSGSNQTSERVAVISKGEIAKYLN